MFGVFGDLVNARIVICHKEAIMPETVWCAIIVGGFLFVAFVITVAVFRGKISEIKATTNGFELTMKGMEQDQKKLSDEMRLIAQLTNMLVSKYQRSHLRNLKSGTWTTKVHRALILELTHLLALGLIDRKPGHGIRSLQKKEQQGEAEDDICNHVFITDMGHEYLRMVDQLNSTIAANGGSTKASDSKNQDGGIAHRVQPVITGEQQQA